MLNYLIKITAAILLLGCFQHAYGQKATEIFIPVGKSPGLSGKYTTIGTVDTVNTHNRTIVMHDSAASYNVKITDSTKVWLDQSKLKASNKTGSFADIKKGLLVEVMYKGEKHDGAVAWIKVQMIEQK